jgi:serine/threonine-protein kinase HipA
MASLAEVRLWGRVIGAVARADGTEVATFQYTPEFVGSGIEIAPLCMPLARKVFSFPDLPRQTFKGLPGLLADSLPDRFGNALIDAWLATNGREPDSLDPIERLCYVGNRGMGALEFAPTLGPRSRRTRRIEIEALVELASAVLADRETLKASFAGAERQEALQEILRVGTSAGGARAKAVIAWNEQTGEVRSGQLPAGKGCGYWLLKFDGVKGNRDQELEGESQGYGRIEYAYSLMAAAAGIAMSECRLLEENGRSHFMTRRFDRIAAGEKLHMSSLCGLAHFDFNAPGSHSYEQAFQVLRRLELGKEASEQLFRRMVFNIVARNQDDHVKNISFLMDRSGRFTLAPAYDLTYNFNPSGRFTAQHQMTLNGKADKFSLEDFRACAPSALMKSGQVDALVAEVVAAVKRWPEFAASAGVESARWERILANLRVDLV